MFLCELPFVCPDEVALADDFLAADKEAIHSMRAGEDEAGNGILRPSELQAVRPPDRGVGASPRRELADVVAAEDRRATTRAEP
jgi:hypothetical protein